KNGRVLKGDVEAFVNGEQTQASAPVAAEKTSQTATPAGDNQVSLEGDFPETREKMSSMRKIIAKAMVNSKHTAPHVTLLDEVDVTGLVAHRKKFKDIAL
ncbi:2-oxo acid dehydrogenase subunit E2, partial [Microvirga sp. 3-52]|nr:2-oxo acid dehydrogenase subunit E2 [Microvirga sp. 3-52]